MSRYIGWLRWHEPVAVCEVELYTHVVMVFGLWLCNSAAADAGDSRGATCYLMDEIHLAFWVPELVLTQRQLHWVHKLGFEDPAENVKGARLGNWAPDKLAATDTDVDNTLEYEREMQGGMLVEWLWDQGQNRLRGMIVGWQKAVEECWVFWRGWRQAKLCSMCTRHSR